MLIRLLRLVMPVDRFTPADRRVTLVIWTAGLVQGFAQSQVSATLPFTRVGLGLDEAEMSLLIGLARLAAFAALPLGWLADRRGRKRPFLIGVLLVLGGGALTGAVVESWQFGLTHAALRTGTAVMAGLAVVILAEAVTPVNRAYAISFYGAAVSLGAGLAILALPLADSGGESWRIPHLLVAAGLLLVPFLFRAVPETGPSSRSTQARWNELIRGPWALTFFKVAAAGFLASAFGSFVTAFTTERLANQVGLGTGTTIVVVLLGGTIGGFGFFVGGRLADHWGRRNTAVAALLLASTGGVGLYTATSVPGLVVAIVVSAFGTFALVPSGGAHRAELFPTRLRSTAGTAATNFTIAGASAGLLVGRLTIGGMGLSGTVYLLTIGAALAAAITASLPETLGRDIDNVAPRVKP